MLLQHTCASLSLSRAANGPAAPRVHGGKAPLNSANSSSKTTATDSGTALQSNQKLQNTSLPTKNMQKNIFPETSTASR